MRRWIDMGLKVTDGLAKLISIGSRREDAFLSLAELGGRDHFHGTRQLLRILDRSYPVTYVVETRHVVLIGPMIRCIVRRGR